MTDRSEHGLQYRIAAASAGPLVLCAAAMYVMDLVAGWVCATAVAGVLLGLWMVATVVAGTGRKRTGSPAAPGRQSCTPARASDRDEPRKG